MAMNWADERYVRVYTRDTADWLCLSFLAQGLLCLLFRKVDRAGVLALGKAGRKAVAIAIGHAHQWALLEPALDELLEDGCVEIRGDTLVIRNFIEAQEAEASDKARSQKYREKRRDLARAGVTQNQKDANPVTLPSQDVSESSRDATGPSREAETATSRDATVTPSRAVPSVPQQQEEAAAADAPRLRVVDESGPHPMPEPGPVERFRQRLAESLARTAPHPIGGGKTTLDSVAAALAVVPEADAVEVCRQRVLADVQAGRRQPATLSAFAGILAEEVTRRKATQANRSTRYVGVDANGQPIPEARP